MSIESGHYYTTTGDPAHFIPKKDGNGNRPTTIADARKQNFLPSVTTVLKVLDKPALRNWLIRQAVYAVTTAPDVAGESLDDKITRILDREQQQDEESQIARDRGTQIHAGLESYFMGQEVPADVRPWMEPAAKAISTRGELVTCEKILVGKGYAGKVDLIQESPDCWWIVDWKSAKTLPDPKKGAWTEHRLQASAYAAAYWQMVSRMGEEKNTKPIRTSNVYISTVEVGNFVICDHDADWQKVFNEGFNPLLSVWCHLNNYHPVQ